MSPDVYGKKRAMIIGETGQYGFGPSLSRIQSHFF